MIWFKNSIIQFSKYKQYSGRQFGKSFNTYDYGCRGDVAFDAKTDELARHYESDFHARKIPSLESGGPKRYMLADEDAWRLFSKYLKEDEP